MIKLPKVSYIKTLGKSLKEISAEHHLNYYTVCSRLRKGYTLEQCLVPVNTNQFINKGGATRMKYFVSYNGITMGLYEALRQVCLDLNIIYSKGYSSNILTRFNNNRDGSLQNTFDRFIDKLKKKWGK